MTRVVCVMWCGTEQRGDLPGDSLCLLPVCLSTLLANSHCLLLPRPALRHVQAKFFAKEQKQLVDAIIQSRQ